MYVGEEPEETTSTDISVPTSEYVQETVSPEQFLPSVSTHSMFRTPVPTPSGSSSETVDIGPSSSALTSPPSISGLWNKTVVEHSDIQFNKIQSFARWADIPMPKKPLSEKHRRMPLYWKN